jgi:Bifunctional DNA primase/polymerase, N-terminal
MASFEADSSLRNSVGKLGPGLEVRCCGGYVVAVGAVHRSGHVYAWKEGHQPDQVALAKPPNWLADRLLTPQPQPPAHIQNRDKGRACAALANEERQLLAEPVGQRNNRLNLAAFRLAQYVAIEAMTRGDIEAVLLDAAARLGIPEREAAATIASGLRAGLKLSVNTRFRD